jgi:hypothetical protein
LTKSNKEVVFPSLKEAYLKIIVWRITMSFWKKLQDFNPMGEVNKLAQEVITQVATPTAQTPQQVQQQYAPQPAPAPAGQLSGMNGPEFQPIGGVALQQYAELLVLMNDVGEDEAAVLAIAAQHGVSREAWEAAKEGWTARMADAALQNRVSLAFIGFYNPAMDRKRGGKEPISLEDYVRIFAEVSFRKDPNDRTRQIDRDLVLQENQLTVNQWNQILMYWSPKVSDANNPIFPKYQQLIDQELKRLGSQ